MADAHAKHHDYHLVDPSPWPIVGAVAAFLMAVGAIFWMHHMLRRPRRSSSASASLGVALHHDRLVARRHRARRRTRAITPAWCRSPTATA